MPPLPARRGGRIITLRHIQPIALPPPPPAPQEPDATETDADFNRLLTEYHAEHPGSGLLFLGATVFRAKDSPPRTLVRWWPEGASETITFWSSADFALIAGGINSFVDTSGNSHHLMIGWSEVDLDSLTENQGTGGYPNDAPAMPDFPENEAPFKILGTPPGNAEMNVIRSLHDVYQNNLPELKAAFLGREQARLAREAEERENPTPPKNLTFGYWRTGTTSEGGNR